MCTLYPPQTPDFTCGISLHMLLLFDHILLFEYVQEAFALCRIIKRKNASSKTSEISLAISNNPAVLTAETCNDSNY